MSHHPRHVEGLGNSDVNIEIYPFYQTPDGEKCMEKTFYYTKYSTIGGAVFSVYEMALNSQPTTISGAIARFGRFTLPFAGMGFVFGASLCLLGQLRKKNDVTNHVLAGALAGSIWGFKYNRIYVGHTMAVYVGFVAGYFKYFDVHNIPMWSKLPECRREHLPRLDFTIKMYEDPGRPREA
ncbi:NADH dehydrogenase [ubiquinone] 1 alpha subcomplex subunit 11-like [Uloborus diversus]|uniref:NADH dehydrogenase [ubiquinone] 1 alpha subcomplex subunit 11-like n=1 Tax=Uloborus diversus TaxID=327109 RepID=UPI0024097E6A|nr:NADH dehydrogenase [ubiquinone] 1 alpha subcomplex subunit 11-like [Uloborus diversus]